MSYILNVKSTFQDKYTGAVYKKGGQITVEDARGEELLADSRGLVDLKEKTTTKKRTRK